MQTKLTLRIEQQIIEQAKQYAQTHGKSLSKIVADYLQALNQPPKQTISPITHSLQGVLTSVDESDYKKHLENKYL